MLLPTKIHTSHGPYTILSQGPGAILRLVQQPYATTLQAFTDRGCDQVSLDDDELLVFLRALPHATLMTALEHHGDCPVCGLCLICLGCECAREEQA